MESDQKRSWQQKIHSIVYESATPAGKAFDVSLIYPDNSANLNIVSYSSFHNELYCVFNIPDEEK